MLKLTGYGARNLRALKDTGLIELKPINILVGRNSAGKSTYARILPLLKQSSERRKQAPVLWFGRLVDFGSFGEAVSTFADIQEIELSFRFAAPAAIFLGMRGRMFQEFEQGPLSSTIDVKMKLAGEGDDFKTVPREISINLYGVEIIIRSDATTRKCEISIGGIPVLLPTGVEVNFAEGGILPQIRSLAKHPSEKQGITQGITILQAVRFGTREAHKAISAIVHGNTTAEKKTDIADRLPLTCLTDLNEHCKALADAPESWRYNSPAEGAVSPEQHANLHRSLFAFKLEALIAEIDESIQYFCNGISYLEPLRATAQRYYRREELSIDELDPKGLNTTFFIQGLTTRDRESLNKWLKDTFAFTLNVKTVGGHATLNIDTALEGDFRNMADVGLGYSQLAPVAIQLWAARRRFNSRPFTARARAMNPKGRQPSVVVIEQPELHLHPAYQAKIADVFAACIKDNEFESIHQAATSGIKVIAETHSPNLINRLGELISENRLRKEDVQVLVFEPDLKVPTASSIRIAEFDEKGILRNWPIGFFDS